MSTPADDSAAEHEETKPAAAVDLTKANSDAAEATPAGEDKLADATTPARNHDDDLPEEIPLTPELVAEDAQRNDFMLRLAVVLLALLVSLTMIRSTGVLVSIRSGEYITSHGFLPPAKDVFSSSADGQVWRNPGWLYDVIVSQVYRVGGFEGLTVFKCLLVTLAFFVLTGIRLRNVPSWWSSVCLILALIVVIPDTDADPAVVTLLGTAVVLASLFRWSQTGHRGPLVLYVVTMCLWSNLDSRAFLGLLPGVAMAMGATINSRRLSGSAVPRQMWTAWLAACIAFMVHPLVWNVWRVPVDLYVTVYPGLRRVPVWIAGTLRGRATGMLSAEYWNTVTPQIVAAGVLLLASVTGLILNRRHFRVGHLLLTLAGVAIAVLARHELPIAAVLWAIVAGLNAQEWYGNHFSQVYSTAASQRLFSVGGRFVTAIAFFSLVWFFVMGHLTPGVRPRIGLGRATSLQIAAEGVVADMDDIPEDLVGFNFTYEHGDLLIWAKRKSFIDSRAGLFATLPAATDSTSDKEPETDEIAPPRHLLDQHRRMVAGLQKFCRLTDDETIVAEEWQQGVSQFDVSHLLLTIDGDLAGLQLYEILSFAPTPWQRTSTGFQSAAFFNLERAGRDEKFLEFSREYKRRHDFLAEAFRQEAELPEECLTRNVVPVGPTWIQRVLTPADRVPSKFVRRALYRKTHAEILLSRLQRQYGNVAFYDSRLFALGHLIVRDANRGLAEEPGSVFAWLLLGDGYALLDQMERRLLSNFGGQLYSRRRYLQSLTAYHQGLALQPDSLPLHNKLASLYQQQNRPDLMLRHVEAQLDLMPRPDADNEQATAARESIVEQRDILQQHVQKVTAQIEEAIAADAQPVQCYAMAVSQGCYLLALKYLSQIPEETWQQVPWQSQLQRDMVMYEAGEIEAAGERIRGLLSQVEAIAGTPEGSRFKLESWRARMAQIDLLSGSYDAAATGYAVAGRDYIEFAVWQMMSMAPLGTRSTDVIHAAHRFPEVRDFWLMYEWSLGRRTRGEYIPLAADMLFAAALTEIEIGRVDKARQLMKECLETAPNCRYRPLVVLYLSQLGEPDVFGVSQQFMIPTWPEMFAPGPARAEKPMR